MKKVKITLDRLRERLIYDESERGFLKLSKGEPSVRAGGRDNHGFHRITVDGVPYMEHHLVWLEHTGQYPDGKVFHRNGDTCDNRFSNLTRRKWEAANYQRDMRNFYDDIEIAWEKVRPAAFANLVCRPEVNHTWLLAP